MKAEKAQGPAWGTREDRAESTELRQWAMVKGG